MVLEHSPIAFPQPRIKPKVDLSPTHFNHILELYLSILDSEEVSPLTISTYRQRIGRFLGMIAEYNLSLDQVPSIKMQSNISSFCDPLHILSIHAIYLHYFP